MLVTSCSLFLSLFRVFFRALLFLYHYLFLVSYHTFFTFTILFISTTSINSNSSITFFLNYSIYSNHFFFFLVLLPIVNLFLVIYFNSIHLSNLSSRQHIQFTFINLPIHTDIQNCENSYQKRFHFSHTDHQFVKVNLIWVKIKSKSSLNQWRDRFMFFLNRTHWLLKNLEPNRVYLKTLKTCCYFVNIFILGCLHEGTFDDVTNELDFSSYMYSAFEIFLNDLKIWLKIDSVKNLLVWNCVKFFKPNFYAHVIWND
jgi:hypothetical protein